MKAVSAARLKEVTKWEADMMKAAASKVVEIFPGETGVTRYLRELAADRGYRANRGHAFRYQS